MATQRAARVAYALALILGAQVGWAQTPPQTSDEALQAMEQMAGVIFSGQVTAVRRQTGANGATGLVEIDFAVDDAVRGVSGSSYTMREWAGLWAGGDEPFRVGQQFLMLLYAPSAAGLSSPVGGMDGAIPIRGAGPAPTLANGLLTVSAQSVGAGTSIQSDGLVVDLRWVQTWVVRPVSYQAASMARPTSLPTGVHAEVHSAIPVETQSIFGPQTAAPVVSIPMSKAALPTAGQSEPYATVLGKLRSWVKDDNATR
jgi:hypothetical protein